MRLLISACELDVFFKNDSRLITLRNCDVNIIVGGIEIARFLTSLVELLFVFSEQASVVTIGKVEDVAKWPAFETLYLI